MTDVAIISADGGSAAGLAVCPTPVPARRDPDVHGAVTPGDIDLWSFRHDSVATPALAAAYEALLSRGERLRYRKLCFERDRWSFLATRALLRWVLSQYGAQAPSQWRFAKGRRGRPRLRSTPEGGPLYFNLSNTADLVVCAVSRLHRRLGVDVERVDPGTTLLGASLRFLAAAERLAVQAQPVEMQALRFHQYWTLKESYAKARGHGLALPVHRWCFLLDDEAEIRMVPVRKHAAPTPAWRFAQVRLGSSHVVAVSARSEAALRLRVLDCVPLRSGAAAVSGQPSLRTGPGSSSHP